MAEPSKSELVPVMSIQCDWEDFIEIPYKQVWISCKFHGEKSTHGKLRGGTLECDTKEFSAMTGRNSICVRHNPTKYDVRFIPAFKVFSGIHTKSVLSVDAADGGLGVSVCGSNKLVVWNNSTGEVLRELTGHVGDVYKCRLFPSGIVVLSGGSDMCLKIWSAETGLCPVTLTGHRGSVMDFCIINRGRNVLSVSKDGHARLWDCGKATCLAIVLKTTDTLNCCAIGQLPDGVESTAESTDREIGTRDKILLTGSEEGRIYAVAVSSRKKIFQIDHDSPVNAVMYFSKSYFLIGSQDGRLCVYSLCDGSLLKTIHESNSPVLCLTIFKDRGVLVGRYDGSITFYSMVSETTDRLQLTGPDCDPVYSISLTSDDVFVGCRDAKIRKYKISDIITGGV